MLRVSLESFLSETVTWVHKTSLRARKFLPILRIHVSFKIGYSSKHLSLNAHYLSSLFFSFWQDCITTAVSNAALGRTIRSCSLFTRKSPWVTISFWCLTRPNISSKFSSSYSSLSSNSSWLPSDGLTWCLGSLCKMYNKLKMNQMKKMVNLSWMCQFQTEDDINLDTNEYLEAMRAKLRSIS